MERRDGPRPATSDAPSDAPEPRSTLRSIIKLFATWAIAWIVGGAVIGGLMASGDTGHIGAPGVVGMLTIAGLAFGCVAGSVFAPVFVWWSKGMSSRRLRCVGALLLGALCGILGVGAVDVLVSTIKDSIAVGVLAGASTGLACEVVHGRRRPAATT